MNLMTGLVRPTRGRIRILGMAPDEPERLFRVLGYCAQFDSFPAGLPATSFSTARCGCTESGTPNRTSSRWPRLSAPA
jgi:ABC-type multidrug transport system ATPase subunit